METGCVRTGNTDHGGSASSFGRGHSPTKRNDPLKSRNPRTEARGSTPGQGLGIVLLGSLTLPRLSLVGNPLGGPAVLCLTWCGDPLALSLARQERDHVAKRRRLCRR